MTDLNLVDQHTRLSTEPGVASSGVASSGVAPGGDGPFTLAIHHLYTGSDGVSHYEDMAVETIAVDFAPPAPKANVSRPHDAKRVVLLVLPPHWYGEMHPAPNRQFMTVMSGRLEVTASDGEVRVFVPGDTALVEDTTGAGHATRNLSEAPTILSVTQL